MSDKYEDMKKERELKAESARLATQQATQVLEEEKRRGRNTQLAAIAVAKADFLGDFEAFREGLAKDGFELGDWREENWGEDHITSGESAYLSFMGDEVFEVTVRSRYDGAKVEINASGAQLAEYALDRLDHLRETRAKKLAEERARYLANREQARVWVIIVSVIIFLVVFVAFSYPH